MSYYSQSKDVVGVFDKNILKFLYQVYGKNNGTFKLNRAITDFILYYNRRKKQITRKNSPYEIMWSRFKLIFWQKHKTSHLNLERITKLKSNKQISKLECPTL